MELKINEVLYKHILLSGILQGMSTNVGNKLIPNCNKDKKKKQWLFNHNSNNNCSKS